jgi:hypothetical protein
MYHQDNSISLNTLKNTKILSIQRGSNENHNSRENIYIPCGMQWEKGRALFQEYSFKGIRVTQAFPSTSKLCVHFIVKCELDIVDHCFSLPILLADEGSDIFINSLQNEYDEELSGISIGQHWQKNFIFKIPALAGKKFTVKYTQEIINYKEERYDKNFYQSKFIDLKNRYQLFNDKSLEWLNYLSSTPDFKGFFLSMADNKYYLYFNNLSFDAKIALDDIFEGGSNYSNLLQKPTLFEYFKALLRGDQNKVYPLANQRLS